MNEIVWSCRGNDAYRRVRGFAAIGLPLWLVMVVGAVVLLCFFFQAEDGIRDRDVTGVQTCALPIYGDRNHLWSAPRLDWHDARAPRASAAWYWHESDAPGFGVSARPRREVCQTRRDAGWPPAVRKARLRFPMDIDALPAAGGGRNSISGKRSVEAARSRGRGLGRRGRDRCHRFRCVSCLLAPQPGARQSGSAGLARAGPSRRVGYV